MAKELMNMPSKILDIIFAMVIGRNLKAFLILLKVFNHTVKFYADRAWERNTSLRLTAFRRAPFYQGPFVYFGVNGVSFPTLARKFNRTFAPDFAPTVGRYNPTIEGFLKFVFEKSPYLTTLTLEHNSPPRCVREAGFHHFYISIRQLIVNRNINISQLIVRHAPLITPIRLGLYDLIRSCQSGLHLVLDDLDKFAPSVNRQDTFPFPIRRLDIRKFRPYFAEFFYDNLFPRLTELTAFKVGVYWDHTYVVEGQHTIRIIQKFVDYFQEREFSQLDIYTHQPKQLEHFISIMEIIQEDNQGTKCIQGQTFIVRVGNVSVRLCTTYE
jgi:hypothetical protein